MKECCYYTFLFQVYDRTSIRGVFCGPNPSDYPLESIADVMFIDFQSDGSIHDDGFVAVYAFIGINPYLSSRLFHPYQIDESISSFRGVWCAY